MPEVLGAFAPRRQNRKEEVECVTDVRAEIVTLGGAIVLALCILLSAVAFGVSQLPDVTGLQRAILVILAIASWVYFFDSVTERLRLVDHAVEFTAILSRRRHVPLAELDAMLLVYQGFNLEKGIESLEFRRHGAKPDVVALGPCWQRHKLEAFLHSVEEALQEPHLFEEIR
jgi:hypothetical protein